MLNELGDKVTLVAVSKTKPIEMVMELYNQGQRHFGENKVQELLEKQPLLPTDIQWHMIGHLQKNKVKTIAPFVSLIHSVDSRELLEKINKEALKNSRRIPVLLQYRISEEETKFGMLKSELLGLAAFAIDNLPNIRIDGLMGMASFSDDLQLVRSEFRSLMECFRELKSTIMADKPNFQIRSMGMSGDYKIAIEEGANMVRIGTLLFGTRN